MRYVGDSSSTAKATDAYLRMPQQDMSLEKVAYEAACRALSSQEDELNQLRSRTGTLLAAGSITASFLGAQTLGHGSGLGTLGALALVAFVCFMLPSIYVLLPKEGFIFSLNGTILYEELYAFRDDPAEYYRRLTYWLEGFWDLNDEKTQTLTQSFFAAAAFLATGVVLWALALRTTL